MEGSTTTQDPHGDIAEAAASQGASMNPDDLLGVTGGESIVGDEDLEKKVDKVVQKEAGAEDQKLREIRLLTTVEHFDSVAKQFNESVDYSARCALLQKKLPYFPQEILTKWSQQLISAQKDYAAAAEAATLAEKAAAAATAAAEPPSPEKKKPKLSNDDEPPPTTTSNKSDQPRDQQQDIAELRRAYQTYQKAQQTRENATETKDSVQHVLWQMNQKVYLH